MLHAFNQKNVRRVLTSPRDEHVNAKDEDGVTSMVFTPLTFMTADAAACVLAQVVGPRFGVAAGDRPPQAHEVRLWPRGLLDAAWVGPGTTRCEPDFVVRFDFGTGPPVIVIGEIKWDWLVSGDHLRIETDRQRRAVAAAHPEARQIMLIITKRRVRPAVPDAVARTWVDVHRAATELARGTPAAAQGRWGALVATFLSKAEQADFQGFSANQPSVRVGVPFFWKAD